MSERDRPLLEGPIGESGWSYRTASIAGHMDFFSPDGEEQSVIALGDAITEVRPLHDTEDRQVLVTSKTVQAILRRDNDDTWIVDGVRPV